VPLILAPSFDDHTREQVEAFLDMVRIRRVAAAIEYQQGKMNKLRGEEGTLENRLTRAYDQLGKSLERIDKELYRCDELLNKCEMLKGEMGLVHDRITLAER
jgi:hypothetical protein